MWFLLIISLWAITAFAIGTQHNHESILFRPHELTHDSARRAPTFSWRSLGFIKQPKTGGTTMANWILQPLAHRMRLQPLRRRGPCDLHSNQTSDYCARPKCPPVSQPNTTMHARIVLDHTLFDEAALTKVLEPPVLYFSVFRPPDEMLRSMYTMAYFQWRHDGPNIRIKNGDGSFCQSLTSDNNNATRWLHGCPAATKQKKGPKTAATRQGPTKRNSAFQGKRPPGAEGLPARQ